MDVCESCGERLHRDVSGWWVGKDETSDCDKSLDGHTVDGAGR